jgi:hypothetical protein
VEDMTKTTTEKEVSGGDEMALISAGELKYPVRQMNRK